MRELTRRGFLEMAGLGAGALGLPGCLGGAASKEDQVGEATLGAQAGANPAEATRPNIVMILADDLGYGDISCYGNETIQTPNIDTLARDGVRFNDFHSNGAVSSPTRAALVTGRYQQRSGVEGVITAARHRDKGLPFTEVTFAEVLKAAGYETAIFGKWHLGYDPKFSPVKRGFDTFRGFVSGNIDYHSHVDLVGKEDWWEGDALSPEEGYTTDLVTEHGVRFIESHIASAKREGRPARPFCLYLPHGAPHSPYQGRRDPPIRAPGNPRLRPGRTDRHAAYKEMIEVMDEGVGRVVETVKRLGLERNTLVMFWSDNGPAKVGSAGGLRGGKGDLWEGGHRVPAAAAWPGRISPGTVVDSAAMGMDLFTTMASAAGAALPEGVEIDGVDLMPAMLEGKALEDYAGERALFWRYHKQRAVRKGEWKLVVTGQRSELFNLDADIGEKSDLSREKPGVARELASDLEKWEKDVSEGVVRQS